MSKRVVPSQLKKSFRHADDGDNDETTSIGPSKDEMKNREVINRHVTHIIESEDSPDTQIYKLMKIYDQLSYTFDLNQKRAKVMERYDELAEEHSSCFKCVTSPCSAIFWTLKKSFIASFYLIALISFGYIIVSLMKTMLIGK
jgi:hypothetical protein